MKKLFTIFLSLMCGAVVTKLHCGESVYRNADGFYMENGKKFDFLLQKTLRLWGCFGNTGAVKVNSVNKYSYHEQIYFPKQQMVAKLTLRDINDPQNVYVVQGKKSTMSNEVLESINHAPCAHPSSNSPTLTEKLQGNVEVGDTLTLKDLGDCTVTKANYFQDYTKRTLTITENRKNDTITSKKPHWFFWTNCFFKPQIHTIQTKWDKVENNEHTYKWNTDVTQTEASNADAPEQLHHTELNKKRAVATTLSLLSLAAVATATWKYFQK